MRKDMLIYIHELFIYCYKNIKIQACKFLLKYIFFTEKLKKLKK